MSRPPPSSTLFPYTTLFRSGPTIDERARAGVTRLVDQLLDDGADAAGNPGADIDRAAGIHQNGAQVRLGDVLDEHEIAGLLPVATDLGRPAGEQPLAGDGDHARLAAAVLER